MKDMTYPLGYRVRNVMRLAYTLPFVLASLTGVAFALTVTTEWTMALLIPLDVFLLALFVNLSNDYFDHKSGADVARFEVMNAAMADPANRSKTEKFYWQGNAFDRGLISEKGGKLILVFLAIGAMVLSIPIILYGGWLVLLLGLIAFFLAFFYTAPPLNLGARGWGELDVLLSFAMISFFSYYVIAQSIRPEPLLIALTVGMNAMLMRIIDEMSGLDAHLKKGEKDLVVRYGIDGAGRIMQGIMVIIYVLCGVLCLFNVTFIILFLTVPLAIRAMQRLFNKSDEFRVMRPVLDILKLSLGHALLVIIALSMQIALTSL